MFHILQVLSWLNPTVKVPVKEKFVTSIGIKASALEGFAQVSVKVKVTRFFYNFQMAAWFSNNYYLTIYLVCIKS